MITLRRVQIHRLRNVQPGTAIELHPGINVLLGRNGSGKTTLLQWLADILSGNVHAWAGEPYDVTLVLQSGQAESERIRATVRITHALERALADVHAARAPGARIELDMALDTPEGAYGLRVRPPHLTLSCPDRPPLALDAQGFHFDALAGALRFALITSEREHGHPRSARLHTFVEDLSEAYGHVRRFDESLALFAGLTAQGGVTGVAASAADQAARLVFLRLDDVLFESHRQLVPDALTRLVEARLAAPARPEDHTTLAFPDADLPFLRKAVACFGHEAATAALTLLEKQISGTAETYRFGNLRFSFRRRDGSIIGQEQLTYGQKRLLAFLCYLAGSPRLVLADELVNGLHHDWIAAAIEALGSRQALLSSHNPLLLDYLAFASPEELRERFVLCRCERRGDHEQATWRNPNAREAKALFAACNGAGGQRLGERLHTQGLW